MEAMAAEKQTDELEENGQVWEQVMQLGDVTPEIDRIIDRLERRLAKVLIPEQNVVPFDKDSPAAPELVLIASIVRNNNECLHGSINKLRRLIDRISV